VKTGAQSGERNDELGGVAEGGVEQSSHALAHSFRELLCRPAHPPCQRQDGKSRGHEHEEISLRSQEFQTNGNGHEDEKPVHRDLPHAWLAVRSVLAFGCALLPIASNSRLDGWKERLFTKLRKESEALERVLHRILQLGEAQLDSFGL